MSVDQADEMTLPDPIITIAEEEEDLYGSFEQGW